MDNELNIGNIFYTTSKNLLRLGLIYFASNLVTQELRDTSKDTVLTLTQQVRQFKSQHQVKVEA